MRITTYDNDAQNSSSATAMPLKKFGDGETVALSGHTTANVRVGSVPSATSCHHKFSTPITISERPTCFSTISVTATPMVAVQEYAADQCAATKQSNVTEGNHIHGKGGKHAVLVTDMSGFTKFTRKYGIVHFTAIIMRMRQICQPILVAHGAVVITAEADNLFVVFNQAEEAVAAALDMTQALQKFNMSVPAEHFQINLGGIGIDYGEDVIHDKESSKLFGKTVNVAFRLGEDVANGGAILLTERVRNFLDESPLFENLSYKFGRDNEEGIDYFELTAGMPVNYPAQSTTLCLATPLVEGNTAEEFIDLILNQRASFGAETAAIDAYIKTSYQMSGYVLMLGFAFSTITEKFGTMACIDLLHQTVAIIKKTTSHLSGCLSLEEFIYIFDTAEAAVEAGLLIRERLMRHNQTAEGQNIIPIKGLAVHCGDLLVVRGAGIHWGDPVNICAKLCEDTASVGEFFITQPVCNAIEHSGVLGGIQFSQSRLTVSDINLSCLEVSSWRCNTYYQGPFQHEVRHQNSTVFNVNQRIKARLLGFGGVANRRDTPSIAGV